MQKSTLYLFRFSHFCEKVKWAADFKKLDLATRYLLPGLHGKKAKTLSGQTSVPLLDDLGKVIVGSSAIIQHWEKQSVSHPLLFDTPELNRQVLAYETEFDTLGPLLRASFFCELFSFPTEAATLFTAESGVSRVFYPYFLKAMTPMLLNKLHKEPDVKNKGVIATTKMILRVEEQLGNKDYLVGNRFSLADLVVASILFPCCFPEQLPIRMSKKLQAHLAPWMDQWRQYQAIEWVKMIYAKHRIS